MFGKKVIIKINGMHCDDCANKVQRKLEIIENVKSVKVNLKHNIAKIKYHDGINLNLVKKAIEDLDFEYLGVQE